MHDACIFLELGNGVGIDSGFVCVVDIFEMIDSVMVWAGRYQ